MKVAHHTTPDIIHEIDDRVVVHSKLLQELYEMGEDISIIPEGTSQHLVKIVEYFNHLVDTPPTRLPSAFVFIEEWANDWELAFVDMPFDELVKFTEFADYFLMEDIRGTYFKTSPLVSLCILKIQNMIYRNADIQEHIGLSPAEKAFANRRLNKFTKEKTMTSTVVKE